MTDIERPPPAMELRLSGNMLIATCAVEIGGEKRDAFIAVQLSTLLIDAISKASRMQALELADILTEAVELAKLRANNLDAHRTDKLVRDVLDQLGH